jgi:RNA polymerase sigma-70 factor (ECF subfamily)
MRIPQADACDSPGLLHGNVRERSARPSALEEDVAGLFAQFRNPLFRYLLSLGLTVPDGEEIIQEVFLALFRHLKSGKPRHNLRGWIFRVGHNQALKLRRRDRLRPIQPDDRLAGNQLDPEPDPEQQALSNQTQRRLSAVIRALPEPDRACLSLRAEGFRYREIAEILGMSLGGVSRSLEQSLAKLSRAHEPGREERSGR